MEELKENLVCFEVQTEYKSGKVISEVIAATDEEDMWKKYGSHHTKKIIKNTCITDCWPA